MSDMAVSVPVSQKTMAVSAYDSVMWKSATVNDNVCTQKPASCLREGPVEETKKDKK